jgi:Na+-transporting NADH:ubiquinone oxidoreductase subunit C
MSRNGALRLMQKWRDLPNEHPFKTLIVALAVSFVCAMLVSVTAVYLKPLQDANQARERQQQIRQIVSRLPGSRELLAKLDGQRIETQIVELSSGNEVRSIDPAEYDQRKAARDPQHSIEIPPEHDIAGIKRRARYATVHLLKQDGRVELIILPVHGAGYASTLYGFLALEGDGNTVIALSFFEHAETPGMGAEVDDPKWRAQWQGKTVRDDAGLLRIGVAKGRVDPQSPAAQFEVDALSGATRTTQGVTNLVRFWLGDYGFGPFLERVRISGD